jgi:alpha-L-fucosidase
VTLAEGDAMDRQPPRYLAAYRELYARDPRAAALQWFRDAGYGLFLHYGLYSLLGRHEWVQFRERIRVAEYATLREWFGADAFEADAIADFAVACGMRYVNLTARHHDSFCLWDTRQTTFSSVQALCGRDLVGELAAACQKRGLGLCLYYSHGRDWRHPHAPNNDRWGGNARPAYAPPEPTYATGPAHDLRYYLDYVTGQITELLTGYGPVAAIWLDGIGVPLHPRDPSGARIAGFDPRWDGDVFRCQELYAHIHALQPQVLVAYKQGYLGTEDFFAPESKAKSRFGDEFADKPGEICVATGSGWGYVAAEPFPPADELWRRLEQAWAADYNLLLNVAPLPDGRLPEPAVATLTRLGERLRTHA